MVIHDPIVNEMFAKMACRLPDYYQQKMKDFVKKEPQTILHGDFHGGNHMYGTGENEGKIVALDYQWAGRGLVAVEFLYFLVTSWGVHNFDEVNMNLFYRS